MRRILALLLCGIAFGVCMAWADELTPEKRKELERKVLDLNARGGQMYQRGAYAEATAAVCEVLKMCRELYPKKDYPRGLNDMASGLNTLAGLFQSQGEYGKAEPPFREALEMRRDLFPMKDYPRGHTDLASSLYNLAGL